MCDACEDPIKLLREKDIKSLMKIPGIGHITAQKAIDKFMQTEEYADAIIAFANYHLTNKAIMKIVKAFGSAEAAVSAIQKNPYILIEKVRGYGWRKADRWAAQAGIKGNDPRRARAYACHYLDERGETNGDSWVVIDDLLSAVQAMCAPMDDELVVSTIKSLIRTEDKLNEPLYYEPDTRRISLVENYEIERDLGENLRRLMKGEPYVQFSPEEVENYIKRAEEEIGFEYTEEQRQAIRTSIANPVSVITGKAGCGKSFSTSAVYKIFESKQLRIATCALSGRASSKLTEITHRPGQTIHKLLGARGKNEFQHDKDHPLELDVLIIDECTLIGADIFLALLQAVKTGTRVIMLGDTHQLEPIGLGNVFADIIKSGKIPVSTLTKIHRQAAASGIITESLKVSNGEQLFDSGFCGEEVRGERKDFKLDIVHDNALVYQNIINEFNALREQGVNADDIQILVPIKERGNVCCKILNNHLQMLINPTKYPEQVEVDSNPERDDSGKAIPGTGTKITLKPNDRIIVMQNDYKSAKDMVGHETPIFNGNVGYIKTIRGDNMYINLTEQGDLILPKKAWPTLSLGYAITVHKKQGDSSPYVIFGLDSTAYALLSKELLYTAITRARKYCVIVAANSVFRRAVTISRVRIKQTWLQFLL